MKIKSLLIAALISLFSFATFAQEKSQENPKYAGIEIVVNVNQASAEEIADLLKGVGLKKAQAIVDYRQQNGLFKNVEELSNVKGIGSSTIEKNIDRIQL
ncbi:ComEA family DNA-binding protein [Vibrio rhodolitus]|uniref:ComEA family DNA-binding protein n=1 Tax=Vibrio rhodolitus TaxID=2231649 RepID=UPI000E0A42AC|nr:ComEA family DNA-binding protein [Vibrio rhodolitus]